MKFADFKLNDQQQKAVEIIDGPVLVIAGAGSGKTRVLTARVCRLLEMGVSPYNILAITFTNKAANEMKERISMFGADDVWASTFHSLCAKILRMEIDHLGYSKDFTIYTEVESDRTIKRLLKESLKDEEEDKETKKNILWCISDAKSKFLDPDQYYKEIRYDYNEARFICEIYKKYEEELRRCNALDFDDLLCKTIQLFQENPDVLLKYANRFKYIHVDEFQDTNAIQYQLVKMLQSVHHNLFVVGDEDQSIYSWRGANIRNILDFPNDFEGTQIIKLERNYRSTKSILEAANNVIKNNRNRNEKVLWTDLEDSTQIEVYEARKDREEAAKVSRAIYLLHSQGEPYSEMAILVRSNSISREFEEELNLNGIPYKVFGGMKFYDRKEIKDFLSYIRLALNPKDNDSFLRATTFPSRKIGDKSREDVALCAKDLNMSIFEYVSNGEICPQNIYSKYSPLVYIIKDLNDKVNKMSINEFLQYALNKSDIKASLKSTNKEEDLNRLENIEELIAAANQYEKDNDDVCVFDFLQSTALISDSDDMVEGDYVTLSTIHAVKGLEFNNVFLAALEENIFPSYFSLQSGDVEEERRLMYVAITRARKKLLVTYCKERFRFGKTEFAEKSRFIDEMGIRSFRPVSQYQQTVSPPKSYYSEPNSFQSRIDAMLKKGFEEKAKAQNDLRNSMGNYKVGAYIEHKKFGLGKILNCVEADGDVKISIQFPTLGIKTFSLAIAANLLRIVDDPTEC